MTNEPLTEEDVRRIIIDVLEEQGLLNRNATAYADTTKEWPKPYPEYSLQGVKID